MRGVLGLASAVTAALTLLLVVLHGSDATAQDGPCSLRQFECRNGKCIPRTWMCEGEDDCGDNSDETNKECHELWKHQRERLEAAAAAAIAAAAATTPPEDEMDGFTTAPATSISSGGENSSRLPSRHPVNRPTQDMEDVGGAESKEIVMDQSWLREREDDNSDIEDKLKDDAVEKQRNNFDGRTEIEEAVDDALRVLAGEIRTRVARVRRIRPSSLSSLSTTTTTTTTTTSTTPVVPTTGGSRPRPRPTRPSTVSPDKQSIPVSPAIPADWPQLAEISENAIRLLMSRLSVDLLRRQTETTRAEGNKLGAERDMLGASRDMLRAESRRSNAERTRIMGEAQKLDIERDMLQSQLLGRRRKRDIGRKLPTADEGHFIDTLGDSRHKRDLSASLHRSGEFSPSNDEHSLGTLPYNRRKRDLNYFPRLSENLSASKERYLEETQGNLYTRRPVTFFEPSKTLFSSYEAEDFDRSHSHGMEHEADSSRRKSEELTSRLQIQRFQNPLKKYISSSNEERLLNVLLERHSRRYRSDKWRLIPDPHRETEEPESVYTISSTRGVSKQLSSGGSNERRRHRREIGSSARFTPQLSTLQGLSLSRVPFYHAYWASSLNPLVKSLVSSRLARTLPRFTTWNSLHPVERVTAFLPDDTGGMFSPSAANKIKNPASRPMVLTKFIPYPSVSFAGSYLPGGQNLNTLFGLSPVDSASILAKSPRFKPVDWGDFVVGAQGSTPGRSEESEGTSAVAKPSA